MQDKYKNIKINKYKKYAHVFIIIVCFLVIFFFGVNKTFAANINFSPISSTHNIGDTIKIKINISSDKSVNAVSGKVRFSKDVLSLVSISKSSSVINLWSREPSFSNTDGSIDFEGVILGGYKGSMGNIITLVFKAKTTGVASLKFSDISILANDGYATEIFSGVVPVGSVKVGNSLPISELVLDEETVPEINENSQESTGVVEVTKDVVKEIEKIEEKNKLPNYSLLITFITVLVVAAVLFIIGLVIVIYRIKSYFKKNILKTKDVVYENFKKLEDDINFRTLDSKNLADKGVSGEMKQDVLKEIMETEKEIIKEIEQER
jgi:hypothetical protein